MTDRSDKIAQNFLISNFIEVYSTEDTADLCTKYVFKVHNKDLLSLGSYSVEGAARFGLPVALEKFCEFFNLLAEEVGIAVPAQILHLLNKQASAFLRICFVNGECDFNNTGLRPIMLLENNFDLVRRIERLRNAEDGTFILHNSVMFPVVSVLPRDYSYSMSTDFCIVFNFERKGRERLEWPYHRRDDRLIITMMYNTVDWVFGFIDCTLLTLSEVDEDGDDPSIGCKPLKKGSDLTGKLTRRDLKGEVEKLGRGPVHGLPLLAFSDSWCNSLLTYIESDKDDEA